MDLSSDFLNFERFPYKRFTLDYYNCGSFFRSFFITETCKAIREILTAQHTFTEYVCSILICLGDLTLAQLGQGKAAR